MAAIQMAYTGVFGWYANWLFLRSGGVVAPMTAHVWCNVMGLPNPMADQERHPKNAACKYPPQPRLLERDGEACTDEHSHLYPGTLSAQGSGRPTQQVSRSSPTTSSPSPPRPSSAAHSTGSKLKKVDLSSWPPRPPPGPTLLGTARNPNPACP